MSGKFPILLYHRVGPRDGSYMDAYAVSPEAFLAQMEQIDREGWRPISLAAALECEPGELPRRTVVITFDDGFASNREHAWPILERFGFPSETFVVTGRLAQSNLWDAPEHANWPLLSLDDLSAADPELMRFHSHSATHPPLTSILHDRAAVERELDRTAHDLSAHLPNWSAGFAYPFGNWNWEVVEKVKSAGYRWACSCLEGLNSSRTNPHLLRRVEVREADTGTRLRLKLKTGRSLPTWPPELPPEIRLAKAWLAKELAKHGIRIHRSKSAHRATGRLGRDLDSRSAG